MSSAHYPTLSRLQRPRILGGVASGLAEHLGIPVLWVRMVLVALSFVMGAGAWLYALLWLFTPLQKNPHPQPMTSSLAVTSWILVVTGAVATLGSIWLWLGGNFGSIVPVIVAAAGALLTWQAYDRGLAARGMAVGVAAGVVLVVAGIVLTTVFWHDGAPSLLLAVALALVGIVVVFMPLVLQLWRSLVREQTEKAAALERENMANQVHDSVLQTLSLIQRRADSPQEVVRLARRQERQLRALLYDAPVPAPQSIFGAVTTAAAEVEELFDVEVSVVTVGEDAVLDEDSKLAVQAAREAMVNAAKHAFGGGEGGAGGADAGGGGAGGGGAGVIDVYVELLAGLLSIFIRDRGRGFDPEQVPPDRHGIKDSISNRMAAIGGSAQLSTSPGKGTEVRLELPLSPSVPGA